MPIKPNPVRIQCRQCGWSSIYAPRSDALLELPPNACEKCGNTDLEYSALTRLESAISSVTSLLNRK